MSAEPQEFSRNFLSHNGVCVLAARNQLDSAASAAFISGSKVMADGQSLDWLQLYRQCVLWAQGQRPAQTGAKESKRLRGS